MGNPLSRVTCEHTTVACMASKDNSLVMALDNAPRHV